MKGSEQKKERKCREEEKALGRAASRRIGPRMNDRTGVGERVGEGASQRGRKRREEVAEEVEVIFRAAPNQLFRQLGFVGARARERERGAQVEQLKSIRCLLAASLGLTGSESKRGRVSSPSDPS